MFNKTITFHLPNATEFVALRAQVGWGETTLDTAHTSLNNSLFCVCIRENNNLIAIGRVIGDGAMYFYIQDVIVHPNYQNQGLGSQVMTYIEQYLSENALQGATIGLLAAKGKEAFYTRYDYIKRPNDALGHGMCKFV